MCYFCLWSTHVPQNLDMYSEGKTMILIKLCHLMDYQQVNEMYLND